MTGSEQNPRPWTTNAQNLAAPCAATHRGTPSSAQSVELPGGDPFQGAERNSATNGSRRRGYGEDSVYFDAANNCWAGAVSLGYAPDGKRRVRRKVIGRTKTEVRDKLKVLHRELDSGIRSSPSYTMALCIEDWLSQGLTNRSPTTVANYQMLAAHAVSKLGAVRLRE